MSSIGGVGGYGYDAAGRPSSGAYGALGGSAFRSELLREPGLEAIARGEQHGLASGSRGASVKALQQALVALGAAAPGSADGGYGPKTIAAVQKFQREHGLSADGKVGARTLEAIDSALGAAPAAASPRSSLTDTGSGGPAVSTGPAP
ncbi:MAG TPA: peptidoglycan-binding domain-containing protein, partial [Planctomycetota bacterium]|nr:peptidoglycan-binding domain-containing protein [Planctomycetota bacterium]